MNTKLLLTALVMSIIVFGTSCSSSESSNDQTETTEQEASPESESIWKVVNVVDEFGDVVEGKGAVVATFKGTMSNSATSSADVTVKVQLGDEKDSYITFYEYNDIEGNLPESKIFNIKIKKENGETEFIEQFSMNNMMADTKGILIQKALEQNEPLKVNVDLSRASDYESTVYNFELDTKGLTELLKK